MSFEKIKKWLAEIIEISLLLITLGVVVEILLGDAVPFFGQVVANLIGLLSTLGENGLVGLMASGFIVFLFYRRMGLPIADTHKQQATAARKSIGGRIKQSTRLAGIQDS